MPGYDSYGAPLLRPAGQAGGPTIPDPVSDHGALTGLADDDHTQYQKESEKDAANGYAGLSGASKLAGAQLPTIDHGSGLTGLADNDHPQYALLADTGQGINSVVASQTVTGTTAETTVATFAIAPGTVPNGARLRLRMGGQWSNSTGSNQNLQLTIKLGATSVFVAAIAGLATGANPRRWTATVDMVAVDQGNQRWLLDVAVGSSVNANVSTAVNALAAGSGQTTVDMTSSRDLVVTATLASATNMTFILETALLERVAA